MSVTERITGDPSGTPSKGSGPEPSRVDAPTDSLLSTAAGSDNCANCGTALAPDQRYCVECGDRRGKSRFSLTAPPASRTAPSAPAPTPPRRLGMTSGTTLIAGIATLLLALGVGVLIGRSGSTSKQPITVVGGGGAGNNAAATTASSTAGTTGSTAGTAAGSSSTASKSSHKTVSVPHKALPTKKAAAAATQAAASTLKSKVKIAPSNQSQGGSCTPGTAGCQGGHFTGNFFGGG